jgi:hypothetical protein
MPLSGSFHLVNADLGHYHVIGGTLSSSGAFRGTIERVQVLGRALIRHFSVTSSHHELGLSAEFVSLVDGVHGDAVVQNVVAHFLHSTVIGHGSISNDLNQHGKTVALDVRGGQARVEDLLRLFVTADRPPLNGQIQFRTRITLPPGEEKFIRRVRLNVDFAIHKDEFMHPVQQ